jgi:ABC-type branched-subunit amino acid transport system ATPase component
MDANKNDAGGGDMLRLEAVGHNFAGLTVLRSVSFSVPRGGIVGLIGPNGSGKTTLFNAISGFLSPQTGRILYRGAPLLERHSIQARSRAGLVRTFQTPRVFENMTVFENIMVGCCKDANTWMSEDLFRTPRANRALQTINAMADEACIKFGLESLRDHLAGKLTAGQRRILEIARAVVGKPQLLLLDEPSSGLNTDEITSLQEWIRRLRAEGMTVLLVSHDMGLMAVSDTVHVLYFGEIIASGGMDLIKQDARVREVYLGV